MAGSVFGLLKWLAAPSELLTLLSLETASRCDSLILTTHYKQHSTKKQAICTVKPSLASGFSHHVTIKLSWQG